MLFTLRWMSKPQFGLAGCTRIGASCQRISRYVRRLFVCRMLTGRNSAIGWLQRMLSTVTRARRVEAVQPKALLSSENAWRELIETLKIERSGTGATDNQCSAGVVCQNDSNSPLADMFISTDVDQQKMLMAVRMQHAIRMGMVEAKHKSALTGLVINRVRSSRSHS